MAISLKATLGLITTPFTGGLKRIGGALKTVGTKIRGMVSGAVGRFAVLAGATGLGMVLRKAIALGSEMSDLADRSQTTVERFGALRELSRDAGVEVSVLERALRNVNLRAQAAADGNRAYGDAVKRLGLDLKGFLKLDSGQKFQAIADAVSVAANKSEAFRDVATLLGERAGPQLTEVLREVREKGLDPLANALVKTGQVMDNDTAKAMDRLEDVLQRAKDQIIIVAAKMLNAFIPAGKDANQALNELVDKGVKMLAKGLGNLVLAIKQAVHFIEFLIDAGGELMGIFKEMDLGKAFKALTSGNPLERMKAFAELGNRVGAAWEKSGPKIQKHMDAFKKKSLESAKAFEDLNKEQGKFAFLANLGANNVARVGAAAVVVGVGMRGGNQAAFGLGRNLNLARGNLQAAQGWLNRLNGELNQAQQGAQQLAGFFGNAANLANQLLQKEQMRRRERIRVEQMRQAALKNQQKFADMTKEGFNALVAQHQQIQALAIEWVKVNKGPELARANQKEVNQLIADAIAMNPELRKKFEDVTNRILAARKGLKNANVQLKLMDANAHLARDAHGELLEEVFGIKRAMEDVARLEKEVADLELAVNTDPAKLDEMKEKLEEAKKKQAELNAMAGKHPVVDPGVFNAKAPDFQVFRDQKRILTLIDRKLGGFFINQ